MIFRRLFSRVAPKADFNAACNAYQPQDLAEAFRLFSTLADQGHIRAMVYLGQMHEYGGGLPVDRAKAINWYRPAALNNKRMRAFVLAHARMSALGQKRT